MIIKKSQKKFVYMQIFKEGLLVVKKSKIFFLEKDMEINNLIVIKLMKGLVSKGMVTEKYCWKYYYFVLNEKGINFLRKFLYVPENIIPLTLPLP